MKTTYYIACHTKQHYPDTDSYTREAGKMVHALQQIFGDREKILAITKPDCIEQCHCEAEIVQEEEGLVGKCVLDLESPSRILLDKSKFSAVLKAITDWPGMKIEKRAVANEFD